MLSPQQAVSERVYLHRKRKGWSQDTLSTHVGCSQDSVSRWEQGKSMPSGAELATLCDLFEVSADYLLGKCDHEQGLPVGMFLVDMEQVATPRGDHEWAWQIKPGDRLVDYREAMRLQTEGLKKLEEEG